MVIQICVGSSCHLKGSEELAARMQKAIQDHRLEDDVVLIGSLCIGKCTPTGVTVQVDDQVYVGVTLEGFPEFFSKHVVAKLKEEQK